MDGERLNTLNQTDPVIPKSKNDVEACTAAEVAYAKQWKYLLDNLVACFPIERKAYCLVHSAMCRVHGEAYDVSPKPMMLNFAGHTCLGWIPPAGKQLGSAHQ